MICSSSKRLCRCQKGLRSSSEFILNSRQVQYRDADLRKQGAAFGRHQERGRPARNLHLHQNQLICPIRPISPIHQHPIPQFTPRSCTAHADGERTWTSVLLRPLRQTPQPPRGAVSTILQLPYQHRAAASGILPKQSPASDRKMICSVRELRALRPLPAEFRARRKPLFVLRFVGSFVLRFAIRQFAASLFQLPPRSTRFWLFRTIHRQRL